MVIRDVTREREAQKAAGQAGAPGRGRASSPAGIAHDFNNILMTIVNSAELAQRAAATRRSCTDGWI